MNKMRTSIDIDKILNSIKEQFEYKDMIIKELRGEINEFNKDEEIQKANDKVKDIRKHSLRILSDREVKDANAFIIKHKEMHQENNFNFWYYLDGCGIGPITKIKCPICGEIEDITDIGDW